LIDPWIDWLQWISVAGELDVLVDSVMFAQDLCAGGDALAVVNRAAGDALEVGLYWVMVCSGESCGGGMLTTARGEGRVEVGGCHGA
jgi:hypothetical protein